MKKLQTAWKWTKWAVTTALPKTAKVLAVAYILASTVYTTAVIDGSEDKVVFWQESQAVEKISDSQLGEADYKTWRNARAQHLRETRDSFEESIKWWTRDAVDKKVRSEFESAQAKQMGKETPDELPVAPQR